ncbi:hypothetical protein JW796_00620 [Candidatus Dojkabacteria bacterium]|nr:hypothetical protein [Candidatus Dojkabacteria bacterium]
MSNPDSQAKTSTPLSQERLTAMRSEISKIPTEYRSIYRIAIAAGTAEAAQEVISVIAAAKERKSEEEGRKKQLDADRRASQAEEKARTERKNAFDSLSVQVGNKLQETNNDSRFNAANKMISGETGRGKKLSEADQDIRELRAKIASEKREADERKQRKEEEDKKEKANQEIAKLPTSVSNLVSRAKSTAESIIPVTNVDVTSALDILDSADDEIERVAAINQYVDQSVISEERAQVRQARQDVEGIKTRKQKEFADTQRKNIVNGIINGFILVPNPDYDTAKSRADGALKDGEINDSDWKRIVDLIDSERATTVSPEARRIRQGLADPANSNEQELNRLEDEVLTAHGNRDITDSEFSALNSEIAARRTLITGREEREKVRREEGKGDTTAAMNEYLRRGFYELDVYDTVVDTRVTNRELSFQEGEELKRQARQKYQEEETRIKTDAGIKKIIDELLRKFDSGCTPVGRTFNIDNELAAYPTLTEREREFIKDKHGEAVQMSIQAEEDQQANMADVVSKLQEEIDNYQGSPEVKAALEKKFELTKKMLGANGSGGLAEEIAEARVKAAEAEKFNLRMKRAVALAKYFGVPSLLLLGGGVGAGIAYFTAASPVLTGVLGVGAGVGAVSGGVAGIKYLGFGGKADYAKVKVDYLEKERDILKFKSELQNIPISQAGERAKFFAERYAAKNGLDPEMIPEVVKIWEKRFGISGTKELTDALNGIGQLT